MSTNNEIDTVTFCSVSYVRKSIINFEYSYHGLVSLECPLAIFRPCLQYLIILFVTIDCKHPVVKLGALSVLLKL